MGYGERSAVTVTVNGVTAQVANRSFLAASVPLTLGSNAIQVTAATDPATAPRRR